MHTLVTYAPLLVGVVSSLILEGFKRLPQIPLSSGQTAKLRTTAAVLNLLGSLGVAVANKDTAALSVIGNTVVGYFVSFLTFKGILSAPKQ